jgi:hypothetical protein
MGGYGSGRRGGRDTTSGYLRLDVRRLQRGGFLRFGSCSSQQWSRGGQPIYIHVTELHVMTGFERFLNYHSSRMVKMVPKQTGRVQ